jgi:hypothetical protein
MNTYEIHCFEGMNIDVPVLLTTSLPHFLTQNHIEGHGTHGIDILPQVRHDFCPKTVGN